MIDNLGLILAAAVLTYLIRFAGLSLDQRRMPPVFERFLSYVPVAVFAALIAPDIGFGTPELPARLVGLAVVSLAVWRTGQLWAGVGGGMLAFWLVRALFLGLG